MGTCSAYHVMNCSLSSVLCSHGLKLFNSDCKRSRRAETSGGNDPEYLTRIYPSSMGWALKFTFVSSLVVTMAGETRAADTGALARASLNQEPRDCPCDYIFTMLESTADGRRVQAINVQERGEPKSGTSFMSMWVRLALDRTCDFLRRTYGEDTCHQELTGPRNLNVNLTFDPRGGNSESTCTCNDVDL